MPHHCFVPGCKSGYNKLFEERNKNVKLFQAPKDEDLRQEWNKLISRADRTLRRTDYVCELHFEKDMIERDYIHIIKGQEVRIPRGKCKLLPTALPTIFSNAKFVKQKKVQENKLKIEVQVKEEIEESDEDEDENDEDVEEEQDDEEGNDGIDDSERNRKRGKKRKVSSLAIEVVPIDYSTDLHEWLSSYPLPDGWSRNVSDSHTFFSYCDGNPSSPMRHVKFSKGFYRPVIYVNGNDVTDSCRFLFHENYIKNNPQVTIPLLFKAVSVTSLCKGIGLHRILDSECSYKLDADCLREVRIVGNRLYGRHCKGYVSNVMPVCFKCKYWERQFEL